MRARRAEAGFTMMELLITLGVTVFGLMGILAAHRALTQGTSYSGQAQEAVAVGTQAMETLRSKRPEALAFEVTGGTATLPYSNATYTTVLGRNGVPYTVGVDVTSVTGSLLKLRVAVSWTDDSDGSTRTLPFELLRTSRESL